MKNFDQGNLHHQIAGGEPIKEIFKIATLEAHSRDELINFTVNGYAASFSPYDIISEEISVSEDVSHIVDGTYEHYLAFQSTCRGPETPNQG